MGQCHLRTLGARRDEARALSLAAGPGLDLTGGHETVAQSVYIPKERKAKLMARLTHVHAAASQEAYVVKEMEKDPGEAVKLLEDHGQVTLLSPRVRHELRKMAVERREAAGEEGYARSRDYVDLLDAEKLKAMTPEELDAAMSGGEHAWEWKQAGVFHKALAGDYLALKQGKERLDDPRRQLALEAAIDRYVPDMDEEWRGRQMRLMIEEGFGEEKERGLLERLDARVKSRAKVPAVTARAREALYQWARQNRGAEGVNGEVEREAQVMSWQLDERAARGGKEALKDEWEAVRFIKGEAGSLGWRLPGEQPADELRVGTPVATFKPAEQQQALEPYDHPVDTQYSSDVADRPKSGGLSPKDALGFVSRKATELGWGVGDQISGAALTAGTDSTLGSGDGDIQMAPSENAYVARDGTVYDPQTFLVQNGPGGVPFGKGKSGTTQTAAVVADDRTLSNDQLTKFRDAMRLKLQDLYQNHSHQIGDKVPGASKSGKQLTYCNDYPTQCVAAGYEALGMHKLAREIREKALGPGKGILDLAKALQERGWSVIFYNTDTSRAGTGDVHKNDTSMVQSQHGKYWGPPIRDSRNRPKELGWMKVDGYLLDFKPGRPSYSDALNDALKEVDFAVIAGTRGNHGAVVSHGGFYDVHRSESDNRNLYQKKDFNQASGFGQTGLMIIPPGVKIPAQITKISP